MALFAAVACSERPAPAVSPTPPVAEHGGSDPCTAAPSPRGRLPAGHLVAAFRSSAPHYDVALEAGHFVSVEVEQRGLDVALCVQAPDGTPILLECNRAEGRLGVERAPFVATAPGVYSVRVRPVGRYSDTDNYSLRIGPTRPATPDDRLRAAAAAGLAEAERLAPSWQRAERESAKWLYERAAEQWRALQAGSEEAYARRRLAAVLADLGRPDEAAQQLTLALTLARAAHDTAEQGRILVDQGPLLRRAGRLTDAGECYAAALTLAGERGAPEEDLLLRAAALNNLSVVTTLRGLPVEAVKQAEEALNIWRAEERQRPQIEAIGNLAVAYTWLGRSSKAAELVQEALDLAHQLDDGRGQIDGLTQLGWLRYLARDAPAALRHYDRGLALAQQRGDDEARGTLLDRRASALILQRHYDLARAAYEEALSLWRQLEDKRSFAHTTANLAALAADLHDVGTARQKFGEAIQVFEDSGEADNVAHVRLQRAQLLQGQVGLDETERDITLALERMQALRTRVRPANLAFYAAVRHQFYELYVDVLRRRGDSVAAFEAAENGRALALADSLAGRAGSAPTNVLALARSLLDDDTLLLAYALGDKRSVLWLVGPTAFAAFDLPPRAELHKRARSFHDALQLTSPRARPAIEANSDELGRVLLKPLQGRLGRKRLVILRDEALQYVPFAALRDHSLAEAGRERGLLIDAHEIVYAPSVLTAWQLRRLARQRRPASRSVAVFADPVFGPHDARLSGRATSPADGTAQADDGLTLAAEDVGFDRELDKLPRLAQTQREADAIAEAAGKGGARVTSGFEVTRDGVLQRWLRDFRRLHFATHGLLNLRNPQLSGLVLSRYDSQGRPRPAFLRLEDIEALDLRAELVVLSACKTALGEELRGEGLLGLTQAFLRAGASQVMVSLWPVWDRPTADLMADFYEAHLRRGLSPAAALRQAQLEARNDPARVPAHWAAFILEGTW